MADLYGKDVDDLVYDSVNLEGVDAREEYRKVSGYLAYWTAELAEVERQLGFCEVQLKETRAEVYDQAHRILEAQHKKVTIPLVDGYVNRSTLVNDAERRLVELKAEKMRVRGIVDSVKMKAEMLISLGATERAELKGMPELRI